MQIWQLFSLVMIIIFLAGLLCIESGCVQKKNNINVAIKSVMNVCVTFCLFFIIGYSIMHGDSLSNGLYGRFDFFLRGLGSEDIMDFLLQTLLCCVSLAIISCGIAERCKFLPFLLMTCVFSLFVYPIYGHWVWGEGWLSNIGFYDFGGATVIHLMAAGVVLAGIKEMGPRQARQNGQGKLREVVPLNAPLYALGVFMVTAGWIGFIAHTMPQNLTLVVLNSLVGAAFAGVSALLCTWAYFGIAHASSLFRGLLGGLVATSAVVDLITPQAAMLIGTAAGLVVPFVSAIMDRTRLDDIIGVVPIHGASAVVGILLAPVFIDTDTLAVLSTGLETPLTHKAFFLAQLIGVVTCFLWSYICGMILWIIFDKITVFNLRPEEEKIGLNYTEHMITDPLSDLNTAVDLIRKEQVMEAKTHFDRLEHSDLEGLSAALRELLNRDHNDL